jgi:hypothetical protein
MSEGIGVRGVREGFHGHGTRTLIAHAAATLLIAALPAVAASDDSCPTWVPDLKCDRQGRYEGFVMPMSMPYLFEDPFITTGANLVGMFHTVDDRRNFKGADIGVLALQLRLAITDKLAFIATKDGFLMYRPDTKISDVPALADPTNNKQLQSDEDAFLNATIGFKYAMIEIPEENFILTPAIRYEIPLGNDEVFQGRGDGVFIPSATAAWGRGDFHVIAGLGGQIPVDSEMESTSLFYNLHLDYALFEKLVPFVELSGIHWTNSGNGGLNLNTNLGDVPLDAAQGLLNTGSFEGADVANLGSRSIKGQNLLTMAWGVRVPLDDHTSLGLSYERGLSGKKHFFEQRVTAMATYEF